MSLPQKIVEVLPPDNELVIGVVTGITPLVVDVRGGSVTPGVLGSYSPTIGDNVALLRQDATYLALGATRNATGVAYGGPSRLVRRGARTTNSTAAAAEQPVLRVDNIPLVMGNQYFAHVPSVNMASTVANDRGNLNLRLNTAGVATTASMLFQISNSNLLPASATGSLMTIGGSFTSAVNSASGSVLLTHSRFAGAGNISLQGGVQFPIELLIYDLGPDVGDTGVDL